MTTPTIVNLTERITMLERELEELRRDRERMLVRFLRVVDSPDDAQNPPTDQCLLFAKQSGGVSRLFYVDGGGTLRGPLT